MEIMSGFECVRIINKENKLTHTVDVCDTTEHYLRYVADLKLVQGLGIKTMRIGVPWHYIEVVKGVYNWEFMDTYMAQVKLCNISPILDPLHHVSVPSWLTGGFLNAAFVEAYCAFFKALVQRYAWVTKFTIINEPTATTYFSCDAGIWYPFASGKYEEGISNLTNILTQCSLYLHNKQHWYIDPCNPHIVNPYRFNLLDTLVRLNVKIDVLGLDYYAHCDAHDSPFGFYNIAKEYYTRYKIPIALTETNLRGFIQDRQTWFVYMYKECLQLEAEIPFKGFCWYPFIDSTDWDSLVTTPNRNIDPQGIIWLDAEFNRHTSEFSQSIKLLNNKQITIDQVATYAYQEPLDKQLIGWYKPNKNEII